MEKALKLSKELRYLIIMIACSVSIYFRFFCCIIFLLTFVPANFDDKRYKKKKSVYAKAISENQYKLYSNSK